MDFISIHGSHGDWVKRNIACFKNKENLSTELRTKGDRERLTGYLGGSLTTELSLLLPCHLLLSSAALALDCRYLMSQLETPQRRCQHCVSFSLLMYGHLPFQLQLSMVHPTEEQLENLKLRNEMKMKMKIYTPEAE